MDGVVFPDFRARLAEPAPTTGTSRHGRKSEDHGLQRFSMSGLMITALPEDREDGFS